MAMDKYCIIKVISSSSHAIVNLATDKHTGRRVVLKEIPLNPSAPLHERQRLTNEVRILSSLQHPNIVKFIDTFMATDRAVLVTEHCEEGDLAAFLRGYGSIESDGIRTVFIQLLLAIKYLHDRKIVHRDLKLRNIFVSRAVKGLVRVKIGDFGIARQMQAFATTIVGTPYYLSPEMCARQPYDFAVDIWSLGCILYELVQGGRHPFQGNSLSALLDRIQKQELDCSNVQDPHIRLLLTQLLQKDADKRPRIDELLKLPLIQNWIQELAAKIKTTERAELTSELMETIMQTENNHAATTVNNESECLQLLNQQVDQAINFDLKWLPEAEQRATIINDVREVLAKTFLLPSRINTFMRCVASGEVDRYQSLLDQLRNLIPDENVLNQIICNGIVGDTIILLKLLRK